MSNGPIVFTTAGLRRGAAASIPLLFGLAPFGLVCGITQQAAGLSLGETMLMAGLVYAGAAQLVVLGAWTHPPSVLAATLTTAVVFFPVTFLYGVSRFLFSALALAVVLALFASYFFAMTVVPLYCARFLKASSHHNTPSSEIPVEVELKKKKHASNKI